MPKAKGNGVELEFDVFGSNKDEPILLIMGLGAQMLLWNEEFCEKLSARGHQVIRFDNRDTGLSTWFDELGTPNLAEIIAAGPGGAHSSPPYTLDDMADDAMVVLDALNIDQAHICGASMGGMIAQTVAIRHPKRVKSLTSIMSTTGNAELPPPTPEAIAMLATPVPSEREGAIERAVAAERVLGSPAYPVELEKSREQAGILHDRAFHPEGTARQMAAIAAHGNRSAALKTLTVPTLVIHGRHDPLVPLEGGLDTHQAVADAELLLIDGMGHNMPEPLWDQIIDRIAQLTARASKDSALPSDETA